MLTWLTSEKGISKIFAGSINYLPHHSKNIMEGKFWNETANTILLIFHVTTGHSIAFDKCIDMGGA